jgi:hypothetical protein
MGSEVALEEAESLCTVISDTDAGTTIPPQVPLHVFAPALEVDHTVSSNAY